MGKNFIKSRYIRAFREIIEKYRLVGVVIDPSKGIPYFKGKIRASLWNKKIMNDLSEDTREIIEHVTVKKESVREKQKRIKEEKERIKKEKMEEARRQKAAFYEFPVSMDDLRRAAEDLNETMGLNPGIDVTELNVIYFMNQFRKACKLAKGTDNFSTFTWEVLEKMQLGPKRIRMEPLYARPPVRKKKRTQRILNGMSVPPYAVPELPHVVGVLKEVRAFLTERGNKQFTFHDILKHLVKKFPDRSPEKMFNTLTSYLPARCQREHGFIFTRLGKGRYKVKSPDKSF